MNEYSPDFIFQRFSSNNFRWNNNFKKVNMKFARIYFWGQHNFNVSLSVNNVSNYIYFNSQALPAQLKSWLINIYSAQLTKGFFSKGYGFNLNNKILYQYVSGSSNVIRIPPIILESSLYYENKFFKRALTAQVGFDIFYNSAYFANAYMPATGQFYLQNEKKIGNYPYVDFFINGKIKSVRMFLKIEHINAGLSTFTYYMVPHYPLSERAFKFGLSWRFLD